MSKFKKIILVPLVGFSFLLSSCSLDFKEGDELSKIEKILEIFKIIDDVKEVIDDVSLSLNDVSNEFENQHVYTLEEMSKKDFIGIDPIKYSSSNKNDINYYKWEFAAESYKQVCEYFENICIRKSIEVKGKSKKDYIGTVVEMDTSYLGLFTVKCYKSSDEAVRIDYELKCL